MDEPTRRAITSRSEFHAAIRSAFAQAAQAGAAEIWLCDASYADWPLNEPGLIDELTRWAQSPRRLTLYAYEFDEVARRHARFTEWRRQWSHVVHCRTSDELEPAQFPTLCWVPGVVSVRLTDTVRHRGLASHEAIDGIACQEAIDALSQRSTEAFPVTTLGL
jgi:hypothetical protein